MAKKKTNADLMNSLLSDLAKVDVIAKNAASWVKIPTGHPKLDWAIGGGIPQGAVTEIYGMPGTGKSTII